MSSIKIEGNNNLVAIDSSLICIPIRPKIEIEKKPLRTKNIFSKKMLEIFDAMNKYLPYEKEINIEVLSELLGLNSINLLLQYFNSELEPEFDLLDLIAEKLGLSIRWLKYSQGNPFDYNPHFTLFSSDIINYLKKHLELNILILISDEVEARIMILFFDSIYKYQRFSTVFPFYQHVGAQGKHQIFEFYKVAQYLTKSDFYSNTESYKISSTIFDAIYSGAYFPGCYLQEKIQHTYFWEDLLDLNHKFFSENQYEEFYGPQFINIQNIIVEKLESEIIYE